MRWINSSTPTRCQIGVYKKDFRSLNSYHTLIYKHSDGYPDNMIPILTEFLQNCGSSSDNLESVSFALVKHIIKEREPFTASDLAYGICKSFHGDIEYYYAISGKTLKVYEVGGNKKLKFKLIESISYIPFKEIRRSK